MSSICVHDPVPLISAAMNPRIFSWLQIKRRDISNARDVEDFWWNSPHQNRLINLSFSEPAWFFRREENFGRYLFISPLRKPDFAVPSLSNGLHHLYLFGNSSLHQKRQTRSRARTLLNHVGQWRKICSAVGIWLHLALISSFSLVLAPFKAYANNNNDQHKKYDAEEHRDEKYHLGNIGGSSWYVFYRWWQGGPRCKIW